MCDIDVLARLMTNAVNPWFYSTPPNGQIKLRLICLPYAGGNALIYRDWPLHLFSTVQLVAVELPGRRGRLREPPFLSLPPLIDSLVDAVFQLLDIPFALFGHSMGALIAFELARALRRQFGIEAQLLMVSGHRAPQIPDTVPPIYDLPTAEFVEALSRMKGTPEEVLGHPEIMELMIPLLKADFRLVQTYQYVPDIPLRCPIVAVGGSEDYEVGHDELAPWSEQTCSGFTLHMAPGNHFFLHSSQDLLLEILREGLRVALARCATSVENNISALDASRYTLWR